MKISKVLRCLWLTVVVSFSAISANASDEAGSAAPTIDRDLIHQGWPLNPAVKELDLPGVFFPESIAADYWGSLYVSSIATGEIVRFTPFSSTPEVFIPVGTNTNSTGVLVDHRRWVLWSCNVDLSMQTPSDLRAFDLWSGELLASYLIPDFGLCADMTLGRNGSLYVTDTLLARVLKLTTPSRYSAENGQLAIWAEDPVLVGDPAVFLKINGIAYSRSGSIYTTNYSTGTLYEIPINRDGSAGRGRNPSIRIKPSFSPMAFACWAATIYLLRRTAAVSCACDSVGRKARLSRLKKEWINRLLWFSFGGSCGLPKGRYYV